MKSVSLHYNEAKPSDKTKHLVYSYFEFVIESDSPEPIPHEVFPDGCLSLIYRRNQTLSIEMFLINGLTLETFHTEMFADDILWGVKFSPAAGSKILRCDPAIIRTTPLIGEEFLSHLTIGLLDKLKICRNFEDGPHRADGHSGDTT